MRQIREALDDDKNMYAKAFDLVKRNVAQGEEPQQYVQLNHEDLGSVGELVQQMLILLEKKKVSVDALIRGKNTGATDVSMVEDVIGAYNKIISVYLNPGNTPQTKQAILTSIMRIEKLVVSVEALCKKALDAFAGSANAALMTRYFMNIMKAYNVYNLIHKQLRSHMFVLISMADLRANYNNLMAGNPS